MRVFDESKTKELFYYDTEIGYLRQDKIVSKHHEATPAVKGVGHYEYKTYSNGGKDRKWVWDVEPTPQKDAYDEYENILVYVPYTTEQLAEKRTAKIKERLEQLSEDFVQAWAGAQIEDIEARKSEFADLHNELRGLLGKAPRVYY